MARALGTRALRERGSSYLRSCTGFQRRQLRGVGVARYVRDAEDPQAAEIAVTIIDGWQGRGLGTELLARLSDRARQEGIRRFTALVAADNAVVVRMLQNMSAELVRYGPGTVEYQIALAPPEEHSPGWRAPPPTG